MRRTLWLMSLIALSVSGWAETKLSLTEAVKRAQDIHPLLKGAQADVDASKARGIMLQAPFKPMIGLNGFGSFGDGDMLFGSSVEPLSLTRMSSDAQGTLNGMLMWRAFSFGRDRVASEIAKTETASSKRMAETMVSEVNMQVRLAYAQAMLKQDIVDARKAALESANEMLRVTEANLKVGKVPQAFVLRAQAEVASMERELAMASADAGMAMASLKGAIGVEQTEKLALSGWDSTLDAPSSLEDALAQAQQFRTELQSLSNMEKSAKLRAKMFDLSSLPELSFVAMGDRMYMSGMNAESSYRLGFVLSFPFGDGGERKSAKAEQLAMAKKAKADRELTKLKADAEVASAWSEWSAVPAIKKAADAEVASAEESYRIALLRYQEGKAILAEVIDARTQRVNALLARADAENYARRAWTMLQRSIGK